MKLTLYLTLMTSGPLHSSSEGALFVHSRFIALNDIVCGSTVYNMVLVFSLTRKMPCVSLQLLGQQFQCVLLLESISGIMTASRLVKSQRHLLNE